ncbi:MAG TPA: protoheme IX farnesyltransferase, partial [Verrucomicrobiales bacterium]|nr:protoheme IX farnesyltransferase [Verrucomicrobiales bacterium]
MKSTVETMESDTGVARSAWSVFAELVKARLTALVLLTTLSGFYLASSGSMDWLLLFNTLFGTGLLACGASVLNQYMERDLDALMPRTAKRPLPSGWMIPEKAFWFGVTLSLVGVLYLMWKVNLLTCVLGALT